MQRVKEGDSEAFRQLVERYKGEIYNFFIRSTGSVEDSEDLTQQCFVNLYNSLDRYKRKASIRTFLYRIATNLAISLNENHPFLWTYLSRVGTTPLLRHRRIVRRILPMRGSSRRHISMPWRSCQPNGPLSSI